jgi:hypothetical protein
MIDVSFPASTSDGLWLRSLSGGSSPFVRTVGEMAVRALEEKREDGVSGGRREEPCADTHPGEYVAGSIRGTEFLQKSLVILARVSSTSGEFFAGKRTGASGQAWGFTGRGGYKSTGSFSMKPRSAHGGALDARGLRRTGRRISRRSSPRGTRKSAAGGLSHHWPCGATLSRAGSSRSIPPRARPGYYTSPRSPFRTRWYEI